MEVNLKNPAFFKQGIEMLSTLFDDVELITTNGEIAIAVIDDAKANNVILKIKKEAIESIKKSKEPIYLNIEQLNKVLKRIRGSEKLHMSIIETERKMLLEFIDPEYEDKKRTFKLMTLTETDTKTKLSDHDSFETQVEFEISPIKIKEIIGDLTAIDSGFIRFTNDAQNIYVSGNTDIINNESKQRLHQAEARIAKNQGSLDVKYSILLLGQIAKLKLPQITLRIGQESPMYINASDNEMEISIAIAPLGEEEISEEDSEENLEIDNDEDLANPAGTYL